VIITSSKSIGCWPSEATLTMRDGALLQQRQQAMREQEAREIIHREPQFMPVRAGLPSGPTILRSDPCIADEDIEPGVIGKHGVGQLSHAGHRRQIGLIERRCTAPCPRDLVRQGFGTRLVAAVNQNLRAVSG
jgi:hypothetical protein